MGYAYFIKDFFPPLKVYDAAKVSHQDMVGNVVHVSSQILNFHEDTQFDLGVIYQSYHLGTRYFMLLYYKNEHISMVYGAALDKVIIVEQQVIIKKFPAH